MVTISPSSQIRFLALLAGIAACLAAPAQTDAARYRITVSAPATFSLPSGQGAGRDYFRPSAGPWTELTTDRQAGKPVTFTLSPAQCGPAGEALVVLGKPDWMTLDDTNPPRLTSVTVGGTVRPLTGTDLALGCVPGESAEIAITLEDDANPLAPDGITFRLAGNVTSGFSLDHSGVPPLQRSGCVVVRLNGLAPGAYRGELIVHDMAPAANRAVFGVSVQVFGITVSPDKQAVSLAAPGADYRLRAHLSEQLLLPGGIWSKLTTRTGTTYLYPRTLTEVSMLRDTPTEKTVLVKASTQDIDGKPSEGLGALEYELTVRSDTPALFVTTRSVNISGKDADNSANWGWLPAAYYVTPEGRKEWRGKSVDKYLDVGRVGWLWLAHTKPSEPGLAWMSALKFGESRFDTMLLYSESARNKPGEWVEMRFAVAPAKSPEETAAIYQDLVARGLLTPPPAPPAAEPAK
ncbi:MAG: hypothetical protein A3K19_02525 [Lentisphaerae bacterium RIFOXYB12_FULL_65_16]|nr:MAG: hypothetical protein A3K18_19485 [Lentisphaerae bacterium RIFOXYA12_64_32]OGV94183.1 MAG: hypothetical protein A3K19_02525 [Lentisphaerae bacterium RIFOXYB12_FULL_65_16]